MNCFYFENRGKSTILPDIGRIDRVILNDVDVDIDYYGKVPYSVRSLKNYINVLGSSIKHVHINDAIGYFHEGLVLGEGDIDFKRVLPLIKSDVMIVIEIKRAHLYPQKVSESIEYVKNAGLLNV